MDARALTVWNKSGGAWRVVAVFLATIPIAKSPKAGRSSLIRTGGRATWQAVAEANQ
jgi:hypothetical protein